MTKGLALKTPSSVQRAGLGLFCGAWPFSGAWLFSGVGEDELGGLGGGKELPC